MKTALPLVSKISRSLRKYDIAQYKVLEWQNRKVGTQSSSQPFFLGRPIKEQHGWILTKENDCVVIHHSAMNHIGEREFSHTERTTSRFQEWCEWQDKVLTCLTGAGFVTEVITQEYRFGSLKQYTTTITKQIRITTKETAQ